MNLNGNCYLAILEIKYQKGKVCTVMAPSLFWTLQHTSTSFSFPTKFYSLTANFIFTANSIKFPAGIMESPYFQVETLTIIHSA